MKSFHKVSFQQFEKDFVDEFPDVDADKLEQKFYNQIKLPERATENSIGYDIFAPVGFDLKPGEQIRIPTGLKIELDESLTLIALGEKPLVVYEWLGIYPRSGQGFKFLRLANTVAVIDFDYYNNPKNEGHIWVKVRNESSDQIFSFRAGDAFCQAVVQFALRLDNDATTGAKREGGLGSTDKRIM